MARKVRIAIATGDPSGIGTEISLKAALDPAVRAFCRPLLVSDPALLAKHAAACGIPARLREVVHPLDSNPADDCVDVLPCPQPQAVDMDFGEVSAAGGRAALAFAAAAIQAALAGEVAAVAAAPQNETAIALAGIPFDGHPSFVARQTGANPNKVHLMLWFDSIRIVHVTLHRSVREALDLITREHVGHVIHATDRVLRQLGFTAPRIAVGGLNPHAGEGGLFGREEIEVIKPAIEDAVQSGVRVSGPFGADMMFQRGDFDAFVVMLHDQGHIPAKLLAPNGAAAWSIGSPILFASVAHGSASDIAGKGIASPRALIEALLQLGKAAGAMAPAA
ncbi:MAG: PdxA family protein [Xanthobacteraceae bacterium]